MWTDPQSMLDELEASDWTCNCGQSVAVEDVRVLASWREMVTLASDEDAYDVLLEHANRIRDEVQARDKGAYNAWNTVVVSVRPHVHSLVDRKLSPDAFGRPVPNKVVDDLRWIVMHAAIELHYASFTTMRAYVTLGSWLPRGHLPIAWEGGIFPMGRAVIY